MSASTSAWAPCSARRPSAPGWALVLHPRLSRLLPPFTFFFISLPPHLSSHIIVVSIPSPLFPLVSFLLNLLLDEGEGLSYTEFSYQLLQAYDFWHLHEKEGCVMQVNSPSSLLILFTLTLTFFALDSLIVLLSIILLNLFLMILFSSLSPSSFMSSPSSSPFIHQFGGSDQWGNITAGIDFIKRKNKNGNAFGFTIPLLTDSEGKKIGKRSLSSLFCLILSRLCGTRSTDCACALTFL